jgi:hypothetical protein
VGGFSPGALRHLGTEVFAAIFFPSLRYLFWSSDISSSSLSEFIGVGWRDDCAELTMELPKSELTSGDDEVVNRLGLELANSLRA